MKKIWIVLLSAGFGMNAMAQSMEATGVDTVTIGSKVAYSVIPDPVIDADVNFNDSRFNWFFTNNADAGISAGITLDETPAGGSFAEDTIHVTYDGVTYTAGTTIKVKTSEVPQPLFGAACDGDTSEINVFFVAVPTIEVNGTSGGGCGFASWDVPLNITGYGPYDVSFTVEYNTGGSPATFTETVGGVSNKAGSTHGINMTLTTATHLNSGTGRYDIVITDIVDRFSGKSVAAITGSVNGAADTYTIGLNPTPTTQPIQHLRNL